jgi:hypothetical protein
VVDWVLEKNMMTCNTDSTTRINRATGGLRAPDITISHSNIFHQIEGRTMECMGSDYLPILIQVECKIKALKENPTTPLRWKTKEVNYKAFSQEVESKIGEAADNMEKSLKQMTTFFTSTIKETAEKHIGKIKRRGSGREWLTPEIKSAIKNRNRLRRDVHNNREEWVNECRRVQDLGKVAKEERWKNFIEETDWKGDTSTA